MTSPPAAFLEPAVLARISDLALLARTVVDGFMHGLHRSSRMANTPPSRIGRAVALAQTGGLVGQALGPAAGAVLAALIDRQHWLFWISGGLMLSGGALAALFVREVKQLAPGPWRPRWFSSLRELLEAPRIGVLILLSFLFAVMWYGSVTNISVFVLQLVEEQGTAGSEAYWIGAAAVALAVSMLIATPLWGRIIDRVGPGRVLALCAAATVVTHLPLLVLETPLLQQPASARGPTPRGSSSPRVTLLGRFAVTDVNTCAETRLSSSARRVSSDGSLGARAAVGASGAGERSGSRGRRRR